MLNELRWKSIKKWMGADQRWMCLLEPSFRKLADSLGLAYIQPILSKEALLLIEQDRYVELRAAYKEMLLNFNIKKEQVVI